MCWVMPPASPAATSVSRIASSSDVLPWSTWPMIVTTGGRGSRSSAASSNCGSSSASSAALTISIFLSNSSARTWTASSDSVCVSVAISPRLMSFLITSGTGTPRGAAARTAAGAARAAGAAAAAGRLGVDDHAPDAAGRAGGALALQRGARGPARGAALVAATAAAVGLLIGLGLGAGLRRHALRRAGAEVADAEIARRAQLLARGLLGPLAVRVLRLLLAGERGVGGGLVHGGGRRLHGDAG